MLLATGMLLLPSVRAAVVLIADLDRVRAGDVGHGAAPARVHQLGRKRIELPKYGRGPR